MIAVFLIVVPISPFVEQHSWTGKQWRSYNFYPTFSKCRKKGALTKKSCHGFTLPGPTVCFSLAYTLLPPHKSTHHAVHLFSSTVYLNYTVFFHSLPFPPSLCLCILSHLLLLSFGSFYHLNLPPFSMPTPILPTASRPFPHLARRFPHECEAGIQGVCRCASLTGSAGAAAGRMCYPDPPRVSTTKACCGDWFLSPRPILTGAVCPLSGLCHVGGPVTCCNVWNALIVAFFCPVPSSLILV